MRRRTLLVDDEPLARQELRHLLAPHAATIEIVGEAGSAAAARAAIAALDPDLLFLDIGLPGEHAFALLESLDEVPDVVFVTAQDAHAIRAFEHQALDYLLKPVAPERLARTVARLAPPVVPDDAAAPAPGAAATGAGAPFRMADRVFLRDRDACWFVAVAEMRLLEVAGEGTRVHFGRGRATSPRSLSALEPRLPAEWFLRINRAQVVGLSWIRQVEPWFAGRLRLRLDDGNEVVVSRRQSRLLADRMAF